MKTISLFIFVLFTTTVAIAQRNTKDPSIRFGNTEAAKATREQILASPILMDVNGVAQVTSFSMTFIPKGKDMLYGPFATKGNTLTAAEIDLIKKFSNQPVKIIIDDIKALELKDSVYRSLSAIFLNYDH